jgi:hypothetical protein
LSTGDPNIDSEDGHPIAYSVILQAAQSYERPPFFLKEYHEQITSDPVMSEKVPGWMNIAAKVATGNRRRVLEDGPDVMNSDDEDAIEDVKPDEEKGMYTAEMDPRRGPQVLYQAQAAALRAAAQAPTRSQSLANVPPRSQTPAGGSSDDDDPDGSETVWSMSRGHLRKNKHFRKAATSDQRCTDQRSCTCCRPRTVTPTDTGDLRHGRSRGDDGGSETTRTNWQKSARSSETSTRGKGLKTSERTGESRDKGPKTSTREEDDEQSWTLAIGGRFRANEYVCCKRQPFQNLSRNLFLRGGFLPLAIQRRSMAQRDIRHSIGYLACTTAQPALWAVVRCSQVPRWGQTK